VDLIVERDDGRIVAIEVKLQATARDSDVAHLSWLRQQLGDDLLDAVVITTGADAYRRADGVAVVPAALLGPWRRQVGSSRATASAAGTTRSISRAQTPA
jgi:predicted AAA+ superfamily ATPase